VPVERRRGTVASRLQRLFVVSAAIAIALTAGSCGGGGGTVNVTLQEFSVGTDPTTIEAGEVVFEATNDGPDDVHEFVVFRTDLGLTELPTDENGAVVETGEGIELIGEIEDIPVGETQNVTLELEAGNYVFICNIWDEDEQEAHYQEGMRTSFTVS
jgi:uncharacterized cupredoxin-like copper-binding protein